MRKYRLDVTKQGKQTLPCLVPDDNDPAAVYVASEADQVINLARELAMLVHDSDVPEYSRVAQHLLLILPSNIGGQ